LTRAAVICEMLDSTTYRALPIVKAKNYADELGITLLESNQLLASYSKVP
jgi:3,4-dihydroxy-2-butanone 4-phosphate synthase